MKRTMCWIVMMLLLLGAALEATAQQVPRRDPRRADVLAPLSPQEEQEALEFLKETEPDRYEKLMRMKESNPQNYQRLLTAFAKQIRNLNTMKQEDPEQYALMMEERKMDKECRDMAEAYRNSQVESEKERIKSDLTAKLNTLFDLRQKNREYEIQRLEKRIAELRDSNKQRLANKTEIVKNRLSQLLQESTGIEW